jgi:arylsulfatase A-like enzyme
MASILITSPVSNIDLTPTLCDLAGVSIVPKTPKPLEIINVFD